MFMNDTQLAELKETAIAEFKMAADRRETSPVGIAVMLRDGFICSANNGLAPQVDMVDMCLVQFDDQLPENALPEDVPADLNVIGICLSQRFDVARDIEPQMDKDTLAKLAESPCISDGQIVHVVHPTLDETRTFKL